MQGGRHMMYISLLYVPMLHTVELLTPRSHAYWRETCGGGNAVLPGQPQRHCAPRYHCRSGSSRRSEYESVQPTFSRPSIPTTQELDIYVPQRLISNRSARPKGKWIAGIEFKEELPGCDQMTRHSGNGALLIST
jgi:hypothetical protein